MFPDITCDDIFRIETSHLWLRWLRAADARAITAFAHIAAVAQMTASIPHPYPPDEADRFILNARAATAAGRALILAVTLKNKGRTVIGLASAQARDAYTIEVGYIVAPAHADKGYATEATTALIDTVFNLTEARCLEADSRTVNPASRRVLEKCGFAYEKTELKTLPARGGKHPCDFFRLDRRVWATRCRERERRLPAMRHQATADDAARADLQAQQQVQQ